MSPEAHLPYKKMKTRITDKKLKRFYRLLSVQMIDFDCGKLCAPKNGGMPYCCENESVVPILFYEEYKWHQGNGKYWKKMPPKTKEIRKFIEESEPYYVFSKCPGPESCVRSKRSLNCMTFPFEPHLSKDGDILGLAYANTHKAECSLIGKPEKTYNPLYISNVIKFWQAIFELYPEEEQMYFDESRKRERRLKRQGKRLRVFGS